MTTTTPPAITYPDTLRAALVELLTGRDHGAAKPEVLAELGAQRRRHADEHGTRSMEFLGHTDRLTVLVAAVGQLAHGVGDVVDSNRTTTLRAALVELAALTLTWLDRTPPPPATGGDPWDEPPF
jgi:hypothetical protein